MTNAKLTKAVRWVERLYRKDPTRRDPEGVRCELMAEFGLTRAEAEDVMDEWADLTIVCSIGGER